MTIDFKVTSEASAHWELRYIFSNTGRKVHNMIDASFELKDVEIIKHKDVFSLHRWAKTGAGFPRLSNWRHLLFSKETAKSNQAFVKEVRSKPRIIPMKSLTPLIEQLEAIQRPKLWMGDSFEKEIELNN